MNKAHFEDFLTFLLQLIIFLSNPPHFHLHHKNIHSILSYFLLLLNNFTIFTIFTTIHKIFTSDHNIFNITFTIFTTLSTYSLYSRVAICHRLIETAHLSQVVSCWQVKIFNLWQVNLVKIYVRWSFDRSVIFSCLSHLSSQLCFIHSILFYQNHHS